MNFIESGLAFLEGLALIASPCILPVLPLVLATSVEGGRRRPFGIIIGFVLAFSLFAMASRKIVNAIGIDLEIIKNASLILLALFGLILFSNKLSEKFSTFTQGVTQLGGNFSSNVNGGMLSGILIGALIGFIWTPCAGPILAAVLVQIIRQESDLASLFIILPFAIGAGIPMLIIALVGRKAIRTVQFFSAHAETFRKIFGVIILLAVAFIASGIDTNNLFKKDEKFTFNNTFQDGLDKSYPAPEFAGIDSWLNSQPLKMQSLKGKVVLIDFWTYSCINCIRTLPYITKWEQEYRDKGLVIIGVHSPEFEFEKNKKNVESALKQYNINYPVALDNHLDTWTNFKNHYWPAHYLINQEGQVVYTHFGEGKYAQTENNIRYLLGLNKTKINQSERSVRNANQTPETYLGYRRAKSFTSSPSVLKNSEEEYRLPASLSLNQWGLEGKWKVEKERIISMEPNAKLKIHFYSKKVFLVLGSHAKKPIKVTLLLNGKAIGTAAGKDTSGENLMVQQQKLYELIDQENLQNGILEIITESDGLEAYAFTFGS